jgi:diguanylate cyclase (GGDEF)-like protein
MHARYPAADFSGLSRQLYVAQRTRVIPDCRYHPVPILGGPEPLDLSRCFLRGAPPELMTYVKLMGAAGVMVNAIVREDRLWGLLVCQHRQPRNPSRGTRALCNLLCQMVGLLVGELQAKDLLAAQIRSRCMLATIAERLETRRPILEGLASAADSLLGLVSASGAYVRLGGQSRSFGQAPSPVIAEAMLAALRPAAGDDISAIHALGRLHPQFSSEADIASGVLLAPVLNDLGDGVIWFRPGLASRSTLTSAGAPDPAAAALRQKALPPGRDVSAWEDVVRGKSAAWTESELLAAQDLRRILTRALLRQTEAELIRVSNADPLTGLPNRRVLNQRLAAWRAQPERPAACLLFLDIDRFKMVNDSLGHFAGDELLRQFAGRLAPLATENRLLSRLGGDEFVIFCEDLNETEAIGFANHVLSLFKERFSLAGRPHRASASIGLSCAKSDPQDLLREADGAMYVAKRQGGNRIAVFAPTEHSHDADKLRTEQDLFLALERNELLLHYQPLVDARTRKTRSYEALVRWRHPERGLLYPDSFIGLAEETGLIGQIGEFVAASAIRQLAACGDPLLLIGINVSASQLVTGGFAEFIRLELAKRRVSGLRLAIEVTESTLMNDQALRELQRMREFGCRVAIDDFGTGYSSLSYLRRLPVDSVKIDRAFLPSADVEPGAEQSTEQEAEPFLRAIVTLAKTLNLRVIAEGVETEAQCALISAIGCELAQGYLFGRPLPPDQWGMADATADRVAPPPRRRPAAKVLSSA